MSDLASDPRPLVDRLRTQFGGAAINAAIRLAERVGRLHPNARPEKHGVEVVRDVPYLATGNPRHRLDVYRPTTGGPWPVVLYFHGGAFSILSKETHWVMGLAFARQGYLTLLAGYRLATERPFPAALCDAAAAWRWTHENAAAYGGDPTRVAVAGESAGANLTMALTVASCFERPEPYARELFELGRTPKAALPACGILQVSGAERFRGRVAGWHYRQIDSVGRHYLAGHADASACALADPLCILESDAKPVRPLPPVFAPVGGADPLVSDTKRLEAALSRRGVTVEAPVFPGEIHAFHALVFRENARRCWRQSYAFLDTHVRG